jgi:hypothetical protein
LAPKKTNKNGRDKHRQALHREREKTDKTSTGREEKQRALHRLIHVPL